MWLADDTVPVIIANSKKNVGTGYLILVQFNSLLLEGVESEGCC